MSSQKIPFADKPWIKNSAWAIAVISLIVTVYVSFFYQKSCKLEYEILSNTSILNKTVELSSIKIIVDSVDVQQSNSNISIIELLVSNRGKNHLRRDDYDNSKFGLLIQNGTLLEKPEPLSASTTHLRNCLNEYSFNNDSIFLNIPTLPLDSKDFYKLKLVILHDNNHSLSFIPCGKIIGQKEILVIDSINVEESFLSKVLQGSFWIHFCRFIGYLMVLISISVILITISESVSSRKKKKLIKDAYSNKEIDNEVVDDYVKLGWLSLLEVKDYLSMNEKELYRKYQSSLKYISNQNNKRNFEPWDFHMGRADLIRHMLRSGYLKMDESAIVTDKKKKKSVNLLVDYIRQNGLNIDDYRARPYVVNNVRFVENEIDVPH